MQNLERQKFEESWKSAFDGAEMTPADGVWNGLEVRLASDESAHMKKRVVFYQRLAAGLTVFALLSGAYAVYNVYQAPSNQITVTTPVTQQPGTTNSTNENNNSANTTTTDQNAAPQTAHTQPGVSVPHQHAVQSSRNAEKISRSSNDDGSQVMNGSRLENTPSLIAVVPAENDKEDNVPPVVEPEDQEEEAELIASNILPSTDTAAVANNVEVAPLLSAKEINALADEQHAREKKEQLVAERMWLGMGGAAGSYNPGATLATGGQAMEFQSSSASGSMSAMSPAPQSNQKKMGSAYSVGMSVGKRVGKRWVLQGGVNLLRQQTEHTSNFTSISSTNVRKSSVAEYYNNAADVSITTPYTVNSSLELISIPVQAGYMIIDRRVGWQINAGVSQDFFIRNTLTDESGNSERFSQGAGAGSPYNTLNWAALLSSELSYRIGDHYRLSLVPGMRYSLRPMLKETNDKGTPLVMDMGFRFKYLFN